MTPFRLSIADIERRTGYTPQRQRHFRDGNPARGEKPLLIDSIDYHREHSEQRNGRVLYSEAGAQKLEAHKKAARPGRKKKKPGK